MIATRSPIVRIAVDAVTPLAITVAVFVFVAGHNRPGGGFAAGLILGAVVALRTVAGAQRRLPAIGLMAAGSAIAALVALLPILGGDSLLDQAVVTGTLPVLGKVKSGSALVFDAGVTLVVVGLVAAALEAFDAGAPRARRGTS